MRKLILLIPWLLIGCASSTVYTQKVSSWVGHDVNELVSVWGYPSSTFQSPNGNTVYGYGTVAYGQNGTYITPSSSYGQYALGGQTTTWYCNTFFEIDKNKKIVSWRWSGNMCK